MCLALRLFQEFIVLKSSVWCSLHKRGSNPQEQIYYIKKILENALLFYTEFAVVFLLLFTLLFSVPVEYILGGHNRLRGAYL